MKLKICGLKYPKNIEDIIQLRPDYIGIIFYKGSDRYIGEKHIKFITTIKDVQKIGVFVNQNISEIITKYNTYKLDYIQLHGDEQVSVCQYLKSQNIKIIKAFNIDDDFNFDILEPYKNLCDYYLFDSKGKNKGGNGIKFNWNKLKQYNQNTPFFLAGGIEDSDIEEIKTINNNKLYAIDINSKFESKKGFKDISKIYNFKNYLNKNL